MKKLLLLLLACFCTPTLAWSWKSNTIKSDEQVIFFPALASKLNGKVWRIDIHGWIFEPRIMGSIRHIMSKKIGLDADDLDNSLARKRLHWFIVDNERGKYIRIRLGQLVFRLNRSKANGHFHGTIRLTSQQLQDLVHSHATQDKHINLHYRAVTRKKNRRHFDGRVLVIKPGGISVISDIDDTIKISDVHDKRQLLANTFVRPYRRAPGMQALYRHWHNDLGYAFHYVTSSPWQLYVPLSRFMHANGYPVGSFHMKYFRWWDRTFLNVFKSSRRHKLSSIKAILDRFPKRRFILVGDDGEQDPEIYGTIARRHPGKIIRILIRNTGHGDSSEQRYRQAFRDLPGGLWRVFGMPDDAMKNIN
jgi:hypothetical protein